MEKVPAECSKSDEETHEELMAEEEEDEEILQKLYKFCVLRYHTFKDELSKDFVRFDLF